MILAQRVDMMNESLSLSLLVHCTSFDGRFSFGSALVFLSLKRPLRDLTTSLSFSLPTPTTTLPSSLSFFFFFFFFGGKPNYPPPQANPPPPPISLFLFLIRLRKNISSPANRGLLC
jgi:hypothetical protein